MAPTTCECWGGPLDGELAWYKGDRMSREIGPVRHVYKVCDRGHYHYEGAELSPEKKATSS